MRLSHLDKELDRPLGKARDRARLKDLRGADLVATVLAVAILVVSTAIAFRERPFRQAEPELARAELVEVAASDPAVGTAPPSDTASQPPLPSVEPIARAPGPGGSVIVIRDPATLSTGTLVAHLPDRALIETSELGPLPVRGADGRRPMDVYARPWSGARGARIAIVIGGLGLSQTGTQAAIEKLPPEVTLALAPQGNSLDRWMQTARRQGHELIMQVPLEPYDYPNVSPGRNTLTLDASTVDNLHDLRWVLSRTTNYTGVMNYMGARFTAAREAFAPIMAEIGARGLLFLDDGTSARSLAAELAETERVPFAAADAQIDVRRDRGAILAKLDELERIARAKGVAIGTGSAFAETVDAVAAWVAEAKKRGIEIVPISAVVNDPERKR
jgi:polysaccharide deacetylase 2 family uncharacterized protein YibQ